MQRCRLLVSIRGVRLLGMLRRRCLSLLGGSVLASACASVTRSGARSAAAPPEPKGVAAVAFDLFTVFDPRGVDQRVAAVVGETELASTWKLRLFEYCWLRAAADRYVDFEQLTRDALEYAMRKHAVSLDSAERRRLESAFTELEPWPDAVATLSELRARGLRLAPLANFAPRMIESLLSHAGLRGAFDQLISTDRARSYKPNPKAYALGETVFGLPRQRIAFVAFGGWDAAGASWFGYPTFWVNRLGVAAETLDVQVPSGPDLRACSAWLAG